MTGSVPSIQPRMVDDLVICIAELKTKAADRGFRTLTYFLDMALIEALTQAELLGQGCSEADLDPVSYRLREN